VKSKLKNMFSSIANNSFSYLLTLDEIRKDLPDETRPSWIKITTITMVSSFAQVIDIKKLREAFERVGSYKMRRQGMDVDGFEWKLKPTTFYNQVTLTYHDTYSTKSVKVFPNGSIQVAGCCDLFDCKRIITQLVQIFKNFLGLDIKVSSDAFRVVMINSNFSLNYNVNLMKVADWFEAYSDIRDPTFEYRGRRRRMSLIST
jgi:TATA-box binding protein (TBP) (component of TFIID and TFIIIB)